MNREILITNLNNLFPNAECELNYNQDYELLIAVVLSAQCTDKRVNLATKELFDKYNLLTLNEAPQSDIEAIIRPVGTFRRKAEYIKTIAKRLITEHNGIVPNDREFLESLPGVGRKTTNVVLSNLFNVPAIAVDTHVNRVSKRLKIVKKNASVEQVEKKLMKYLKKEEWSKSHHQLVLFGRYICTAKKPNCQNCPFNEYCQEKKI